VHPRIGAALGILRRSDMFAAIDNTVVLPGYTRVDAAGFVKLTHRLRAQINVENLFDKVYFINADSNTNISPGFPRAVRVGLTAVFGGPSGRDRRLVRSRPRALCERRASIRAVCCAREEALALEIREQRHCVLEADAEQARCLRWRHTQSGKIEKFAAEA